MLPRLVSFKLCPFVQQVRIALLKKGIDHDVEYVDLSNPPEWFLEVSPFKKVPLLVTDNTILFESIAINEFLEESGNTPLLPREPMERARCRSWIIMTNTLMWSAFHLSTNADEAGFLESREGLLSGFDQLEGAIQLPFFNGEFFSLVDASYAPLLQRLQYLGELYPELLDPVRHPMIHQWMQVLLALEEVQQSSVPEFRELYFRMLARRQGFISRFLDSEEYPPGPEKQVY